jgi:Uri superfamily endonuclease
MLSKEGGKKARWHVDHISLDGHFELVCTVYAVTLNRLNAFLQVLCSQEFVQVLDAVIVHVNHIFSIDVKIQRTKW